MVQFIPILIVSKHRNKLGTSSGDAKSYLESKDPGVRVPVSKSREDVCPSLSRDNEYTISQLFLLFGVD